MKTGIVLFSSTLIIIVGSSFTHANTNKISDLDVASSFALNSLEMQDLQGTKSIIVTSSSSSSAVGTWPGTGIVGVTGSKNDLDPGTGTGGVTKMQNLINSY